MDQELEESSGSLRDALIALLLQRHRAIMLQQLGTALFARFAYLALFIVSIWALETDLTPWLWVLGASCITTSVWWYGNRRSRFEQFTMEEALSRLTGGAFEDVYILAR